MSKIKFWLSTEVETAEFVLDENACEGLERVVDKVREDVKRVTGNYPNLVREMGNTFQVVAGILGQSSHLDLIEMENPEIFQTIRGKRECYYFGVIKGEEEKSKLVIAGSDKRGCIYGLFHISEFMGVSPWVTFGDVIPKQRKEICITQDDTVISKEPSIKYRGFFINDEWPAFGKWTFEKFGGFTAQMYDIIFETILRLKGNYLWPAMWTSSFSLDGPDEENARLADVYGIVMSNSHHEPCLRHSEEWDLVRGEDSPYGNDWDYRINREGLLKYWEEGLQARGKYENIITIGMRGERDSILLEEGASISENIAVLKDVITQQRKLIKRHVEKENEEVPQLLVIYKEVEDYFYGSKDSKDGLKHWEGLDGVTLMLCEDNYGNLRSLPEEEMRNRKGGWGLYYHFDYHGSPVSYEWVNSSYLPKIWDQLIQAYAFGIRDIWIVNVGDLKFQEYPLSFFMDLAYDFETWGNDVDAPERYIRKWVKREFGNCLTKEMQQLVIDVMKGYTKLNHNRKPEATSPEVYHPVHYRESERILCQIEELEKKLEFIKENIPKENMAAFWELVYYPAAGSLNVQKLNIYAGLNHYFAKMRVVSANVYGAFMQECIEKDRRLTDEFHHLLNGKWNHMGDSKHIGFCHWNDEESGYPIQMYVEPLDSLELAVYVQGESTWTSGGDWTGKQLVMRQFLSPKVDKGILVLENRGKKAVAFTLESDVPWIEFSQTEGCVTERLQIEVRVEKKHAKDQSGEIRLRYENRCVLIKVPTGYTQIPNCPEGTFLEEDGVFSIEAEHYAQKCDSKVGSFQVLKEYGKTKSGIKAFPVDRFFQGEDRPSVKYLLYTKQEGLYDMELFSAPANPIAPSKEVGCCIRINGTTEYFISLHSKEFHAGDPSCTKWCEMVLNQIIRKKVEIPLRAGLNEIEILAETPGFVLEKFTVCKVEQVLLDSYLGPEESYFIRKGV